jgi:hypothetical protein
MAVQTLDQIVKSISGVYNPQVKLLRQRQSAIPQSLQAEEQGLQAKQTQSFEEMIGGARRRGLGFSGIPIQEQAKYNATEYMPALARLKQSGRENAMSLEEAILGVRERQNTMASQMRDGQLSRDMALRQLAEQRRQFDAQLAEQRAAAARASSGGGGGFSPSMGDIFGGGGGGGSAPAAGGGNKIQQQAEANLQKILSRGRDYNTLRNDLLATVSSAQRGNKMDQAKIQLYRSLVTAGQIPDIFRAHTMPQNTALNTARNYGNSVVNRATSYIPGANLFRTFRSQF